MFGPVFRLVLLSFMLSALWAEAVAVHPQVCEDTLSVSRLRDMLLGRVTTWKDGTAVVIVLVEDSATDLRVQELIGRDRDHLLRGWKRLVFSGSGAMPLLTSSPRDALEMVAKHPGAIALLADVPPGTTWRRILVGDETATTQGGMAPRSTAP